MGTVYIFRAIAPRAAALAGGKYMLSPFSPILPALAARLHILPLHILNFVQLNRRGGGSLEPSRRSSIVRRSIREGGAR